MVTVRKLLLGSSRSSFEPIPNFRKVSHQFPATVLALCIHVFFFFCCFVLLLLKSKAIMSEIENLV